MDVLVLIQDRIMDLCHRANIRTIGSLDYSFDNDKIIFIM